MMTGQPPCRAWRGLALAFLFCASSFVACGDSSQNGEDLPPGLCATETKEWPIEGQNHVPEGSQVIYGSNPPSSGNHYPVWGRWGVHAQPLDRGYYVHNLEHGGVAILYRCDGDCPDLVAGLKAILDSRPQDPACASTVRSRIVLTADPLLDTQVAAASWGHTYRAPCLDAPSLNAFIDRHYDQAPESTCAQGYVPLN
jgi:hypothetical protein